MYKSFDDLLRHPIRHTLKLELSEIKCANIDMEGQQYLSELLAVAAVPIVILAQRLRHGKLQHQTQGMSPM